MEEVEGFEPPRGVTRLSVFKTDPFSRTWVYLRDKKYNIMYSNSSQHFSLIFLGQDLNPAQKEKRKRLVQPRKALEGRPVKSLFDFIERNEIEKYSRLPRNAETGDSDKEALFASAGGVEVSEFLGGDTGQATRGARRWS
jgi:hypothetical protein